MKILMTSFFMGILLLSPFKIMAYNLIPEDQLPLSKDKILEKLILPIKNKHALVSENRIMPLPDICLNQAIATTVSLRQKDEINFSDKKLINPVVGQNQLVLVHTPGHEDTGGFFGQNVRGRKHLGIDIKADPGTVIQASGHGKVHYVGFDRRGYGWYVIIRHETAFGKIFETRYAHLSKIAVRVGETVLQGDKIGLSGKTGNANHPWVIAHLHFEYREVINDRAIASNPLPHLVKNIPSNLKNYFAIEGLSLNSL